MCLVPAVLCEAVNLYAHAAGFIAIGGLAGALYGAAIVSRITPPVGVQQNQPASATETGTPVPGVPSLVPVPVPTTVPQNTPLLVLTNTPGAPTNTPTSNTPSRTAIVSNVAVSSPEPEALSVTLLVTVLPLVTVQPVATIGLPEVQGPIDEEPEAPGQETGLATLTPRNESVPQEPTPLEVATMTTSPTTMPTMEPTSTPSPSDATEATNTPTAPPTPPPTSTPLVITFTPTPRPNPRPAVSPPPAIHPVTSPVPSLASTPAVLPTATAVVTAGATTTPGPVATPTPCGNQGVNCRPP